MRERILLAAALAVMLLPFGYAVWMSFAPGELLEPPTDRWSLRWYAAFFGSPRWRASLLTTAQVAALSTTMAAAGGLCLAVAVARRHFRGRAALTRIILLPLFAPPVVLGLGMLAVVSRLGLRGTVFSLAASHALIGLPIVYLMTRTALEGVDADLISAARGLGASPWAAFRRVTLPLILPAVAAGAVIAAVISVNEFTFAVFLSTPRVRTLPAALWPEARDKETPLLAAASCASVALTLAGVAAVGWLGRRVTGGGQAGLSDARPG